MFLLLIGLFSTVLSYDFFRKSDQFCPYYQRMYISKPMSSLVSCAVYCNIDKAICSRFVYDENQKECILYQDKPSIDDGLVYTSTEQRLFLSSHEGGSLGYDFDSQTNTCIKVNNNVLSWHDARERCQADGGDLVTMETREKWEFVTRFIEWCSLGYDFDSQTNTCIKVNNNVLSWHDARERCQADGGDLVTMETREKWEFVTRFIECTTDAFWIGLWNTTWLSGSIFDNIYGLHTSEILLESEPSKSCGRLRFNAGNLYIIRSVTCAKAKKSLCELPIPP